MSKPRERKPDPMDVHVGSRVRLRRTALGISQEKLGEKMELTFQQIQKYEKGTNRIGASRLFQLSQVLDVPIDFFFEDAPISAITPSRGVDDTDHRQLMDFLKTQEGQDLNHAFANIQDPRVRKHLVELVCAVVKKS